MKKSHIFAIASVVIIVLCVVLDIIFASNFTIGEAKEEIPEETTAETEAPETEYVETEAPETEDIPIEYKSPIDFAALSEQNEHIYSWIKIPNSNIDYPIVQHPTDNTFYNRRGIDKNYSIYGSIFTEYNYNSIDFNDPVTLIYGHHTYNSLMFGDLQTMYKEELTTYSEIVIYLPEKELHYEVFGAVINDKLHILYYNDFTNPDVFNNFFGKVLSKNGSRDVVNKECELTPDDKIIILSTCLDGNPSHRYIVLAKLVEVVE